MLSDGDLATTRDMGWESFASHGGDPLVATGERDLGSPVSSGGDPLAASFLGTVRDSGTKWWRFSCFNK